MSWSFCWISFRTLSTEKKPIVLECEYEWLPIKWPSSIIRLKIYGCFSIWNPMQKKVALALNFIKTSKTWGVNSVGPSSKVIAIFFEEILGLLQYVLVK